MLLKGRSFFVAESEKKVGGQQQKRPFFRGYPSTKISPTNGTFEDDFPLPQVGYVIVPWRVKALVGLRSHNPSKPSIFRNRKKKTYLMASTHLKNMLVKLEIFPK